MGHGMQILGVNRASARSFEFVRGKDNGAAERRIGPSMLWGVEGLDECLLVEVGLGPRLPGVT